MYALIQLGYERCILGHKFHLVTGVYGVINDTFCRNCGTCGISIIDVYEYMGYRDCTQ